MIRKVNSYELNNIAGGGLDGEDKEFADWFYSKKPILKAFLALPYERRLSISCQEDEFKQTFNSCVEKLNALNSTHSKTTIPLALRKTMYDLAQKISMIESKINPGWLPE